MSNPEELKLPSEGTAAEDFKKAFDASTEGFDVNVGGMIQHFKNREEYMGFLDEANDRDNQK